MTERKETNFAESEAIIPPNEDVAITTGSPRTETSTTMPEREAETTTMIETAEGVGGTTTGTVALHEGEGTGAPLTLKDTGETDGQSTVMSCNLFFS